MAPSFGEDVFLKDAPVLELCPVGGGAHAGPRHLQADCLRQRRPAVVPAARQGRSAYCAADAHLPPQQVAWKHDTARTDIKFEVCVEGSGQEVARIEMPLSRCTAVWHASTPAGLSLMQIGPNVRHSAAQWETRVFGRLSMAMLLCRPVPSLTGAAVAAMTGWARVTVRVAQGREGCAVERKVSVSTNCAHRLRRANIWQGTSRGMTHSCSTWHLTSPEVLILKVSEWNAHLWQ